MTTTSTSGTFRTSDSELGQMPRPDYPRPAFDRSHSWLTLNGRWDFSRGLITSFEESILVPFAWESPASGVEAHWLEHASYRRTFSVPSEWAGERVVLHFGAVHHQATVTVDGTVVGSHVGGSLHFEFDITDALTLSDVHDLLVTVNAPPDKRGIVHGKQRSIPRDDYDSCAFTPSSGIWQPVWLEARPETYLDSLSLAPTDDLSGIRITGTVLGTQTNTAMIRLVVKGDADDAASTTLTLSADELAAGHDVPVSAPRLWSPADPYLYSVMVEVHAGSGIDRVTGTTGIRRIETRGNAIFLNGQRISLRGVLDQGYWPESGITAPSDEAFIRDLEIARDAGFTMVRKHLKLEDPRFYHHADKMGMLVWAEPASTGRFSESAAAAFEAQVQPMAETLGNHPSIIVWGLYNEEWGLDWALPEDPAKQVAVREVFQLLKTLDPSRPVVDNSGWTHLETDLVDWHVYDEHPAGWAAKVRELVENDSPTFPVSVAVDVIVDKALMIGRPVPRDVPFLNSEFGGGWTSIDRGWNLHWQTQELRRHDDIAGWVWTELNDIEHESAGIVDTARSWKDNGGRPPRHANGETATVFDVTPHAPGRDIVTQDGLVNFGVAVSHHGAEALNVTVSVAWGEVFSLDPIGEAQSVDELDVEPFCLSEFVAVAAALPEGWESGRMHVILHAKGTEVGRGAIDVVRS